MKKQNTWIFEGVRIVAWIIFIGLCIEAGGLLVNFMISIWKPGLVKNLYQKLDLSELYLRSSAAFYSMYGFLLGVALLKAYLFYLLIMLLHKLNLNRPFEPEVALKVMRLSYCTLWIGILNLIGRETSSHLLKRGYETEALEPFWAEGTAFILMAAVIYIIAIIFRRGMEIQSENDLTV